MADYANYQFYTKPNEVHEADPVIGPLLKAIRNAGKGRVVHILHKWMTVAVPASETEVRTSFTVLFDGVATPIVLFCASDDNTQDKAAGSGAKQLSILATTSTHVMAEETLVLNGTTAGTGATLNEHLNEAKMTLYGADGEPTGTIIVCDTTKAQVYATIANTGHCAINARTYIPAGYDNYLVVNAKANYNGIVSTATGRVIGEGGQVRFKYVATDATSEPDDLPLLPVTVGPVDQGWADITPPKIVRAGGSDAYVTLLVDSVDSDLAGLMSLEWTIVMWT
jgi:hypothetical protein